MTALSVFPAGFRSPLLATVLCLSSLGAAHAGDHRFLPSDTPAAYAQECASCHTAYPPSMLPARSWQRIMSGLGEHYGSDASLDEASARRIGAWLQAHAGTYKRRKVDAAAWRHASVKSAANCAACHVGADQGHFDDDDLRVPPGLEARYRRAWSD
jgi:mono/diheme cytochrome c family protein